jgi:hypothetical protein
MQFLRSFIIFALVYRTSFIIFLRFASAIFASTPLILSTIAVVLMFVRKLYIAQIISWSGVAVSSVLALVTFTRFYSFGSFDGNGRFVFNDPTTYAIIGLQLVACGAQIMITSFIRKMSKPQSYSNL